MMMLSPQELGDLMHGQICVSPDNLVMLCYTPDGKWMAEELKKVFDGPDKILSPEKFNELIREGLKRAEI